MDHAVKLMGKQLTEVKGGGQGQAISKSEVTAAADGILAPVMDLLDGQLHLLSYFFKLSSSFYSKYNYSQFHK